eukprot:5588209-Amphidinium_carterae.1
MNTSTYMLQSNTLKQNDTCCIGYKHNKFNRHATQCVQMAPSATMPNPSGKRRRCHHHHHHYHLVVIIVSG